MDKKVPYALTAIDIKRMRTCDALIYSYKGDGTMSKIRVLKDRDEKTPWDEYDDMPVDTWIDNYDKERDVATISCYMRRYNFVRDSLATMLDLLRPGDVLSVHVVVDNNNGYLNDAGLHNDCLSIEVKRGKKTLVFDVEHQICPDNLARMCQMKTRAPYVPMVVKEVDGNERIS